MTQPWFPGAVAVVVAAVAIAQLIMLLRSGPGIRMTVEANDRRVRAALVIGIAVGLVVASLLEIVKLRHGWDGPSDNFGFGYDQAFSPMAGAAAALVVLLVSRRRPASVSAVRTAELSSRRGTLRRSDVIRLGVLIALLCLVTVALVSTMVQLTENSGWSFLVTIGHGTNEAAGFSPTFVAEVIIGGILVGALATAVAILVRNSAGSGRAELQREDEAARRDIVQVAIGLAVAALGLSMASVLWHAGATTWPQSDFPIIGDCRPPDALSSICHQVGTNYAQPAHLAGFVELIAGILAFGVSTLGVLGLARRTR